MDSTQPSVLIVILNYGTYQMTIDLIRELKQTLDYDNYSIMVVDNCSPNESAEELGKAKDKLGYIFYPNTTNAGYAAGNNIGIRYGIEHGYVYSWILNNDVELRERNVLQHIVGIAEADERIGCIGPKIYSPDGSIVAPYCRRPTFYSMTIGIVAEKRYRQKNIEKSGEVYRVYGCCMLLKNKAMADVDFLDERTFLYGEEDILGERLLKGRYTTYYDASVSVTHLGSDTMKKMNMKKSSSKKRNISLELYLREYRGFNAAQIWACKCVRSVITLIR